MLLARLPARGREVEDEARAEAGEVGVDITCNVQKKKLEISATAISFSTIRAQRIRRTKEEREGNQRADQTKPDRRRLEGRFAIRVRF